MPHKELVGNMINDILDKDFTSSRDAFEAIMADKISDTFEQKKIDIASSVYAESVDVEEEVSEEDV